MTLSLANTEAITCCNAVVDSCDNGTGTASATLVIYSGVVPALVDTALSGNTVLAQLSMSNPAFGNAVDAAPGATATASAIADDVAADAADTASFFRILDRDSTPRIQGAVTESGGGGDLIINTVDVHIGALVITSSLTVTIPEG